MLNVFVRAGDSNSLEKQLGNLGNCLAAQVAQCENGGQRVDNLVTSLVTSCKPYLTEHVPRKSEKAKEGKPKVSYTISADDVGRMIEELGVGAK
jgi:hypothetical protein